VLGGWIVTSWQVTLGFTLGVQLVYLVLVTGLIVGVYWLRRGRPRIEHKVVGASAAGIALLALVAVLQAQPYLRVADEHPEATRTRELVTLYSPPVRGFVTASQDSLVWSGPTARAWDSLTVPGEQALFPGIAILLLAGLGLRARTYPRGLRVWLGVGTLTCAVLSLGLRDDDHATRGWTPYRILYELAPGWDAFRTPGRIHTLTSLGLALLAAAGTALLAHEIATRPILRNPIRAPALRRLVPVLVAGVASALILLEGLGPTQHPAVPTRPPGQAAARDPQLHLPSGDGIDGLYAYWSIGEFPALVNGYASFVPTRLERVRRRAATFPDAASVSFLRSLGVRTVVLHPQLARGTPWEDAAGRPVRGLPLTRERADGVILYHLDES